MVAKRHMKGRLSSEIDRNRVKLTEPDREIRKKRKLITHRVNYYAMNNNITQDGTQVFIYTDNFEEE